MENAKVIKAYRDKDTSQLHIPGDDVELSKDRAKELAEKGYVKIVAADTSDKVEKAVKVEKSKPATKEEKAKPETKEEKEFE